MKTFVVDGGSTVEQTISPSPVTWLPEPQAVTSWLLEARLNASAPNEKRELQSVPKVSRAGPTKTRDFERQIKRIRQIPNARLDEISG